MLFIDNFSQGNKLDAKNQRENPTEMIFMTVNYKTSKKGLCTYLFILSRNG